MFFTKTNNVFELKDVYILRVCWAIYILIDTLRYMQISKPSVLRKFMRNFAIEQFNGHEDSGHCPNHL